VIETQLLRLRRIEPKLLEAVRGIFLPDDLDEYATITRFPCS